jgi:YggT family protein
MEIVFSRLLLSVAFVLGKLLSFYGLILFVRVIAGWLNADPRNWIVNFLSSVTDPLLYEIRRRMPFVVIGGLDLSPLVVFLGIGVLQILVVGSLEAFAYRISVPGLRVG